ncbi:hypothetical protein Mal64_20030 [Pseudobythopirellula maris]|uniref:PEP-CTERM protein-sorting domain-containing protein n=1 Tax=Pseudobythopirellula maris TaxID=2527991 RepID=A0A5C5ZMX6_9BACT|nr:hypothetical protein [Pseudobythopirellula maris]TWT88520.1 hypothetical protein Mal64_20030 [Pseudobythopirellula maris]
MTRLTIATAAIALLVLPACAAQAERFQFGSNANGVSGLTTATVTEGPATMTLAAAPYGAVFNEASSSGLGLNSRAIAGVTDNSNDKFDVLGGAAAGEGESITFSFDQPGYITMLDFDGVKDESFEFFYLTIPGGEVWSIFDSQIGLRLKDIGEIAEPNVTLLTEAGAADDDLFDLHIPFQAGEVFTLQYSEYFPDASNWADGFTPFEGNGSKFQGLEATFVPEPTAGLLGLIGLAWGALAMRRV